LEESVSASLAAINSGFILSTASLDGLPVEMALCFLFIVSLA
jgi:hypothetical protein